MALRGPRWNRAAELVIDRIPISLHPLMDEIEAFCNFLTKSVNRRIIVSWNFPTTTSGTMSNRMALPPGRAIIVMHVCGRWENRPASCQRDFERTVTVTSA